MPKKSQKTQRDFHHTWFVREWAAAADLRQADIIRETGWGRATVSDIFKGQQYTQSLIDVLAPIFKVKPYELLLHPDEAMALRRLRADVLKIASSNELAPIPAIKRGRGVGG